MGGKAGPQAGQRKAETQCTGRETAWPSRAELWTHCSSQGQVTSPGGTFVSKGRSQERWFLSVNEFPEPSALSGHFLNIISARPSLHSVK